VSLVRVGGRSCARPAAAVTTPGCLQLPARATTTRGQDTHPHSTSGILPAALFAERGGACDFLPWPLPVAGEGKLCPGRRSLVEALRHPGATRQQEEGRPQLTISCHSAPI
jgi:hypothetical protein